MERRLYTHLRGENYTKLCSHEVKSCFVSTYLLRNEAKFPFGAGYV